MCISHVRENGFDLKSDSYSLKIDIVLFVFKFQNTHEFRF